MIKEKLADVKRERDEYRKALVDIGGWAATNLKFDDYLYVTRLVLPTFSESMARLLWKAGK